MEADMASQPRFGGALDSTEAVSIPVPKGRDLPAALALPAQSGDRGPAVIVLHEILGLNADIRRICRRFAGAGYVALAPDFMHGLGARPLCMARFMRGLAKGASGEPFQRLAAARRWLSLRPDVDGTRIGVVGFCIGGGFALLYAAGADIAAVAAFYAAVPADPERALRRVCPVVASYGGRDGVFGKHAARLSSALVALAVLHDVKTYPEAGHSFMNQLDGPLGWVARRSPMHAGYHGPSAEDAWARTFEFLGRHLAPNAQGRGRD
jgi:carboxymethylenebutenolidase